MLPSPAPGAELGTLESFPISVLVLKSSTHLHRQSGVLFRTKNLRLLQNYLTHKRASNFRSFTYEVLSTSLLVSRVSARRNLLQLRTQSPYPILSL